MSGTRNGTGEFILVGGDVDRGGIWRLINRELVAEPAPVGDMLHWASFDPLGNLLAVGRSARAVWRSADGTWTEEKLPAGDLLWGCILLDGGAAWAVGADTPEPGRNIPVLLRRQNGTWRQVELPPLLPEQQNAQLFKIALARDDDALVVGDQGIALHWDGTTWSREDPGTTSNLVTVVSDQEGGYFVVGGLAKGVVLRRSAKGVWSQLAETAVGLNGVARTGEDVLVSGLYGWVQRIRIDSGQSVGVPDSYSPQPLHFALADASGDAWVGGGSYLQPGVVPMKGVLLQWSRFEP